MISWPPLFSFFLLVAQIPPTICIDFNFITSANDPPIINFSGGSLQVAGGQPLQRGNAGAYYVKPIQLWHIRDNKTANFNTYFEFSISFPSSASSSNSSASTLSGGFAFFLAPEDSFGPPNSRSSNSSNGTFANSMLAVEFDSFRDNSTSNGTTASNDTLAAQISYNASSKDLLVTVKTLQVNTRSIPLNLSHVVDVRQTLPQKVVVGFSVANRSTIGQKITKWNFTSDLETEGPERFKFKIWMLAPLAALFLAVLAGTLIYCLWRGKGVWIRIALVKYVRGWSWRYGPPLGKFMDDEFSSGTGPRRFLYRELAAATSNFSEKRKLGEGGFGGVYKGFLIPSEREVAVKKISRKSKQGRKEYESEVKIISRLRHRNLVQLLGWCHERGEFLLVYEFLPNGSLYSHLFNGKTSLPWHNRYTIAVGLGKALLYLHEEWEQCVVHRDVKSSNVMLDSNFNAKLGDFGLARLVDHQLGQHATGLAGTLGYLAPECFNSRKATKEADVYSFGIVALEIASGRRAVEHEKEEDEVRLVEWVWELNGKGRLLEAADKSLVEFDVREMEQLMLVGLWCAHPDHTQRPAIKEVIRAFNFERDVPSLPAKMPVPVFAVQPIEESNLSTPTFTYGSLTTGR